MLGSIINLAIGLIVLRSLHADSTAMIFAYAVTYGMAAGGAFAMIQLVIAEHFAGLAYGKILGIFTFVDTMAGALGTQVIGIMRVTLDSYIPALNLMISACVIAAICVIVMNKLAKRARKTLAQAAC